MAVRWLQSCCRFFSYILLLSTITQITAAISFFDLTRSQLPNASELCQAVNTAPIPGCKDSDFQRLPGQTCSSDCAEGLARVLSIFRQTCALDSPTSPAERWKIKQGVSQLCGRGRIASSTTNLLGASATSSSAAPSSSRPSQLPSSPPTLPPPCDAHFGVGGRK